MTNATNQSWYLYLTSKKVNHRDISMQICSIKFNDYSGMNKCNYNALTCVIKCGFIWFQLNLALHSPLVSSIIRFSKLKIKKYYFVFLYTYLWVGVNLTLICNRQFHNYKAVTWIFIMEAKDLKQEIFLCFWIFKDLIN